MLTMNNTMNRICFLLLLFLLAAHHVPLRGQDVYYPDEPALLPMQITNLASFVSFDGEETSYQVNFIRVRPVADGTSLEEMLDIALSDFPFVSFSGFNWNLSTGYGSFQLTFAALPQSVIQRRIVLQNPDDSQIVFRQTEPSHFLLCQRDTTDMIPNPADSRELYLVHGILGDSYSLYKGATLVKTVACNTYGEVSFGSFHEPGIYTVSSAQCGPLPLSLRLKYADFFLLGNLEWELDFSLEQEVPAEGGTITLQMGIAGLVGTAAYYSDLFGRLYTFGIPGDWPAALVPISFSLTPDDMTISFSFPRNNTGEDRVFDTGFHLAADTETLTFTQPAYFNPFNGSNYIGIRTYTTPNGTSGYNDVTYYDGLGYPEQTVSQAAAPNGKTVILPIIYDCMRHKDSVAFLPYAKNMAGAGWVPGAVNEQHSYWQAKDSRPFSEQEYEASPGGRPLVFRPVGAVFAQEEITVANDYRINNGTEGVLKIGYNGSAGNTVASVSVAGYYPAGSLSYVRSINENSDTSFVFTDSFHRPVLTRRLNNGIRHDTYYVRDMRDSVVCIIQPEGTIRMGSGFSLDGDLADRYCFLYDYDSWGNLIAHHVPGGGWTYTVFDARNRPVLTTESELMHNGYWRYTEYDALNRIVEEGLCKVRYSIPLMRSSLATQTDYSSLVFGKIVLHTCEYYNASNTDQAGFLPISGIVGSADKDTQHCLTMLRRERVYEAPEMTSSISQPSFYRERKYFYDYRGLPVQIVENDSDGSAGRYSYKYDFTGNVVASREEHAPYDAPSAVLTINNTFSDRGILLESTASADGMVHRTVYTYDDFGRLVHKHVNEVIDESFDYNTQGWCTHANMTLTTEGDDDSIWDCSYHYYTGTGSPRSDGKLSSSIVFTGIDTDEEELTSTFTYDHLGRLSRGEVCDVESIPVRTDLLEYDRNGNILRHARQRGTESVFVSDTCNYTGNRLSLCRTEGRSYSYNYDHNGAMTYDGKNRVTLTRNILGQPYLLEQAGGACVEFSYLADGTKRYMVLDNSEGPQYYGSFIYRYDEAAGETYLESIAHPEGRFAATSYTSQHEPVYSNLHYVTERVGSTVAIVDADADAYSDVEGTVLEGNGYTPFGERFAIGDFPKMHLNRFRFNGKEHLNRFGLPYIDYGARYYDPTVARWHHPDPMADKHPDTSPYAFCANDPVNFVDPSGEDIWRLDSKGYVIERKTDTSRDMICLADSSPNTTQHDKSIEFDYGTIHEIRVDQSSTSENRHTTLFSVNSETAGANLFKFVSDNTQIEHGMILTTSGQTFVLNDHRESSINVTGVASAFDKKGLTITAIIHSHPKNTPPSGFKPTDNKGDRFQAANLVESHGYKINHYVYQPQNNGLIEYTQDAVLQGLIIWDTLFIRK